jgi:hypothetical protein
VLRCIGLVRGRYGCSNDLERDALVALRRHRFVCEERISDGLGAPPPALEQEPAKNIPINPATAMRVAYDGRRRSVKDRAQTPVEGTSIDDLSTSCWPLCSARQPNRGSGYTTQGMMAENSA